VTTEQENEKYKRRGSENIDKRIFRNQTEKSCIISFGILSKNNKSIPVTGRGGV
jgi:hypothetical protein